MRPSADVVALAVVEVESWILLVHIIATLSVDFVFIEVFGFAFFFESF